MFRRRAARSILRRCGLSASLSRPDLRIDHHGFSRPALRCSQHCRLLTSVVAVVDDHAVLVNESHALEPVGPRNDGAEEGDLTGLRVWEAAPYLIRYLDRHREHLLQGRTVLDVGSGTGAVGLAAAAMGASSVILSDADSVATLATDVGWEERRTLAVLEENVALNGERAAAVRVQPLRWGCSEHIDQLREIAPAGFDTICASDVLYYPQSTYAALATTIRALAADDAAVVLSYRVRHGLEHTFIDRLLYAEGAADPPFDGPIFECVARGAADAASLSSPSFATRVVELRARYSRREISRCLAEE